MNLVKYIGKSTFNMKKHLEAFAVINMPNPDSEDYQKTLLKLWLTI